MFKSIDIKKYLSSYLAHLQIVNFECSSNFHQILFRQIYIYLFYIVNERSTKKITCTLIRFQNKQIVQNLEQLVSCRCFLKYVRKLQIMIMYLKECSKFIAISEKNSLFMYIRWSIYTGIYTNRMYYLGILCVFPIGFFPN